MNKKKRIKELEERVAQLERARSIYNEYWQTYIVGLEQRIEKLEARLNTLPVSVPQPYSPTWPEPLITNIWPPTTTSAWES